MKIILQKNSPISNVEYIVGNVALAKADVIVNASNGCGYMGGKKCIESLHCGVAQSLQFYSQGLIEKQALIKARRYAKISAWIFGQKAGSIFVTNGANLKCKEVVHAVTMRYAGCKSSYKAVKQSLESVFKYCTSKGHYSIALPLLGCGTGRLVLQRVCEIIESYALTYNQIQVMIYIPENSET